MQALLTMLLAILSLAGVVALVVLAASRGRAELARALAQPRRREQGLIPISNDKPDLSQRVRHRLPARAPPDPSIRTRPAQFPPEARE